MTDDDDDEWVALGPVGPQPRPPADVVPRSAPAADDYRRWNDAVGRAVVLTTVDEPMLDVDGVPHAMPAPVVESATFAVVGVTAAELAAVGLVPGDVPNLRVLQPIPKENSR